MNILCTFHISISGYGTDFYNWSTHNLYLDFYNKLLIPELMNLKSVLISQNMIPELLRISIIN